MSTHTKYFGFTQSIPKLTNEFTADIFLQDYLKTYFPTDKLQEIIPDLENLIQLIDEPTSLNGINTKLLS